MQAVHDGSGEKQSHLPLSCSKLLNHSAQILKCPHYQPSYLRHSPDPSTHFFQRTQAWKVGKYFLTRSSVTEKTTAIGSINLYSPFLQCLRAVSPEPLPWSLMANSSSDPRVHNSSGSGWWDLRVPARRKPKPVSFPAKDTAFSCQNSSPS